MFGLVLKVGLTGNTVSLFPPKVGPLCLSREVIESGEIATLLQYMSGLSGVEGRDFHSYSYLFRSHRFQACCVKRRHLLLLP